MDIIKNISIIFTSIFFESLPFLLLGSFISSIIEVNISNDKIAKMIPKNKILGSIVGIFLGFFIPACDCAVIPITKRLIKKKVPINVSISFMLASPIINPVVLLSTYYAFYKTNPEIFFCRIVFGIIIALLVGVLMGNIFDGEEVIIDNNCAHCHCHSKNKFLAILKHAGTDLHEVVKYLMIGALIASIIQVMFPRELLDMFNNNNILSIITLMIFAYLVSLCSTADSFVGKSLLSSFSKGSIIAYLLLGPMIDIKNTLVLLGNYKKSFVFTLITFIFIITFIFSYLVVRLI